MHARSRRVHAAGVMSVALVAMARAARPSRRVRCVRVPQAPLHPPPHLAPIPTAEVVPPQAAPVTAGVDARVDASVVLTVADWPAPPVPFEDIALWQPTEVMVAVVVEADAAVAAPGEAEADAAVAASGEGEADAAVAAPGDAEGEAAVAAPGEAAGTLAPSPEPEPTAAATHAQPTEPEPTAAATHAQPTEPEPTPAATHAQPTEPEPTPEPRDEPANPTPAADPIPAPPEHHPDPWGWSEPWAFEIPPPGVASGRRGETARDHARGRRRGRGRRGHPMIALAVIVIAVAAAGSMSVLRSPSAGARPTETADVSYSPHPSAYALRTVPAAYLHDYWKVADEYGLDWTKLAAVGQIESDQGRSRTPGVSQGTNPAGAAGPAQFLGPTWARYGVDADGRGTINPYDPADAITAMAAYLKASGAPQDWRTALFTYNHSMAYVNAVLALSRRYLASSAPVS